VSIGPVSDQDSPNRYYQLTQGNDTDSLGATVGSILGAYYGPGHLEEHWLAPFNDEIPTGPGCFYGQSLSQVAKRMGELPKQVAAETGAQTPCYSREAARRAHSPEGDGSLMGAWPGKRQDRRIPPRYLRGARESAFFCVWRRSLGGAYALQDSGLKPDCAKQLVGANGIVLATDSVARPLSAPCQRGPGPTAVLGAFFPQAASLGLTEMVFGLIMWASPGILQSGGLTSDCTPTTRCAIGG
jgi:hypothetical protein